MSAAEQDIATAKNAGEGIHGAFCAWHQNMVRHGVFSPCCFDHCPVNAAISAGVDPEEPRNLKLQGSLTLGDLVTFIGPDHWNLVKNCPQTIRDALAQMQAQKQIFAYVPPGPRSSSSVSPTTELVEGNLREAAYLQVDSLCSALYFFDLPEAVVRAGLTDLLTQLLPSSALQGLTLCSFLRAHFSALDHLSKIQVSNLLRAQDSPRGQREREDQANQAIRLLMLGQKALASMDLAMDYLEQIRVSIGESRRYIGTWARFGAGSDRDADDLMVITGTLTEHSAELVYHSFLNALVKILPAQDTEEGMKQTLLNDPASEPLEAIVRLELLLCHFMAILLAGLDWCRDEQGSRDKEELMIRYQCATRAREKMLQKWMA